MGSSKLRVIGRMLWPDICRSDRFRGRWIALDNVLYDPATSQPVEADVVDVDDDIGDLCARMRESDRTSCAIVHCHDDVVPQSTRRVMQHSAHR